jgi:hypothetical protein
MKIQNFVCSLAALSFALALPAAAHAAEPTVKVGSAQAAKGTRTVVIGAFNVGFIFQSVDNSKASGGMLGAFGGTTKANSVLEGVTPQMMQAITDAAYLDFKSQLAAKGFAVADAAPLFASPDFKRVKVMPSPYEASVQLDKKSKGKATYYKPTSLPAQFMLPGDVPSSGMSGLGLTMAAGTNQYGVSQFAKTAGQAVVDVVYLIDFSNVKRPGAFSFGGLKVNSGMSVVDDLSKLSLVTPAGKTSTITINEAVAVEGDFADMRDTTKGAGLQKAANIFGGLAAVGGLGGMRFGKTKTFTFTAKPAYAEGAIKAATLANARLTEQLAALR